MTKFLKMYLKKYHKRKLVRQSPPADHAYRYEYYIAPRKKNTTRLMSHIKRTAIIKKKKEDFIIDATGRGFRGRKVNSSSLHQSNRDRSI